MKRRREKRTANASGFTPRSISEMQMDKVLRSRWQFCKRGARQVSQCTSGAPGVGSIRGWWISRAGYRRLAAQRRAYRSSRAWRLLSGVVCRCVVLRCWADATLRGKLAALLNHPRLGETWIAGHVVNGICCCSENQQLPFYFPSLSYHFLQRLNATIPVNFSFCSWHVNRRLQPSLFYVVVLGTVPGLVSTAGAKRQAPEQCSISPIREKKLKARFLLFAKKKGRVIKRRRNVHRHGHA